MKIDQRKVIQISAIQGALYALCDDGSIWVFVFGANGWERCEDIPQD